LRYNENKILEKETEMPNTKRTISNEIDRLVGELEKLDPDSQEYEARANRLEVLCKARGIKPDRLVSTDVLVASAVNILGILLILNYENLHVVSSKALGFVLKGRV